jgi:hypothetical protein
MTATKRHISLSQALLTWRHANEFYFLRRFLDEMRSHTPASNDVNVQEQVKPKSQRLEPVVALARLLVGLIKVFWLPRNKVVVFNHTKRCRIGGDQKRSLYISEHFLQNQVVLIEDAANGPSQKLGYPVFAGWEINRGAELIAWFYTKLVYKKCTIHDRDIVNFYVKFHVWRLIFIAIRPKTVFTFVWYGKEAIVAAAKSLGIKVCDVQHGIIYSTHPHYQLADAPAGSEAMRPDECLVYGEFWKEKLLRSAWTTDQVRVAGYFLDIAPAQFLDSAKPYILYTSQPHTHVVIKKHINAILDTALQRGWQIIIALHPSDGPNAYHDTRGKPGVSIGTIDSYDLLRNCHVHISVSSTLLWESMLFNKPSYVLNFGAEAYDLLNDFVELGFGRSLAPDAFPEPFQMPITPHPDYFFQSKVAFPFLSSNLT